MADCVFRNNTIISDHGRPYFVAEVNSSHRGSIETAFMMIDEAKNVGCDCVKFQSWSPESLYCKTYYDENPISKKIVSKFSFTADQLKEISAYCKEKQIAFSSTPYSEEEADLLIDECDAPFVKIASMEINNLSFLRYIGAKKVPIVLSTGMSTLEEIKRAVYELRNAGTENMVILHCVSVYPAPLNIVNLNNICSLKEMFPEIPVGYSDHTQSNEAAIAAVAMGAGLIERHFTLDNSRMGMDNNMATEPEDFKRLIEQCKNAYQAMGSRERVITEAEEKQRLLMRRSIIARHDLLKGHFIEEIDLYAKRPGTGIGPDKMNLLIGRRVIRDIPGDTIINIDDIE